MQWCNSVLVVRYQCFFLLVTLVVMICPLVCMHNCLLACVLMCVGCGS